MRVQEEVLKIEQPTREDKIKQLIKYLDGMLLKESNVSEYHRSSFLGHLNTNLKIYHNT